MLGSAVTKCLQCQGGPIYRYFEPFDWSNPELLKTQFKLAVADFTCSFSPGERWAIYWTAGLGAMGSTESDLDVETANLKMFLGLLREHITISHALGAIGFASSAGALYSESKDFEVTELSAITTLTEYAKAKLAQEKLLKEFVSSEAGVDLLVARFSTLYGPGQSFGKKQGLLSHIARCALKQHPVELFVPLDTARDYLFVDDAASLFVGSLQAMLIQGRKSEIRIIAAERSVTISEIISTFNRLIKKPIRFVSCSNSLSAIYSRRVSYRSNYPLDEDIKICRHTLIEGAAILLNAERAAYIAARRNRINNE